MLLCKIGSNFPFIPRAKETDQGRTGRLPGSASQPSQLNLGSNTEEALRKRARDKKSLGNSNLGQGKLENDNNRKR
jgi:hypothetical protein